MGKFRRLKKGGSPSLRWICKANDSALRSRDLCSYGLRRRRVCWNRGERTGVVEFRSTVARIVKMNAGAADRICGRG
jgi:hypothetical protein